MKLRDLRITKQLGLAFSVILALIAIIGVVSLYDSASLWMNTKTMYEHPLAVRMAIGDLQADVLNIRLQMKELILTNNEQTMQERQKTISTYEADAYEQFDILYSTYSGKTEDIDKAKESFVQWKPIREETIRLMRSGKIDDAMARTTHEGVGGMQAEKVISDLSAINSFSKNIAESLYNDAQQHKDQVVVRLSVLFVAALLLLGVVSLLLRRGILIPLKTLTAAVKSFKEGETNVKSNYISKNEFGDLSNGFNAMVETVQSGIDDKANALELSRVMVAKNDLHPFCEELLKALLCYTDSQLGAIYILNEGKKAFELIESIGLNAGNHASFSMQGREGEFGTVLASGKVQHLTVIPDDAQLTYSAVSGDYKVREIMTIPILKGSDVVSVISIASVKSYSGSSIRLVNNIAGEISARLNSVLASQRILDFSEKLKNINTELEQQTKELSMQTDELTEQNIELEMQKNQLDEASRLKSAFLSNMSHELRTPLNSVIALTSVLNRRLQGKIPEEEYSYLDVIERNGKGLLSLVNDLLDLSRIEAGKEDVTLSRFDIKSLVDEVLEMLEPQAQKKGIALTDKITYDQFEMISDQDKCRHILQNIVGNAVKFTDEGSVEISFNSDKDQLNIIVQDTGIGIAPEHIGFIFDEFRQADETPSRRNGGTGLGLAIAKDYAQLLGGDISVESTLGKGSVFTITLPLKRFSSDSNGFDGALNNTMNADKITRLPAANGVKHILLIEDSEPAIIQTTDFLTCEGYNVFVSRSGTEALEQLKNNLPDGIILDLMMPGMDGFQTLKAIRDIEKYAGIPVLILTSKHVNNEELSFLKSNHVYQLIQKGSVDKKELLAAVENLVDYSKIKADTTCKQVKLHRNKRHIILVVEDNPDNMITVNALLKEKYDIEMAADGIIAVEKAGKVKPSLILMDISLPGMNGFQAFMEIRKIKELKTVPVIAMTASAMAGNKEEILEYGFDGYISKPIDLIEMEAVIGRYLNGE